MEVIKTEESILNTIKEMIGPSGDYEAFNTDLMVHINTFLGVLNQLGVGVKGFQITGDTETWADFIGDTSNDPTVTFHEVRTYIYMRVKTIFDPPASSTLMQALNENIQELGWRLMTRAETQLQGAE